MRKILFIIIVFCYSSCVSSDTKDVEYYFSNIKENLHAEELDKLKEYRGKELIDYVRYELGERLYEDSVRYDYISELDSIFTCNDIVDDNKFYALYVGVHMLLNEKEIDLNEMNDVVSNYRREESINSYLNKLGKSQKARENYESFQEGDEMCLIFPYITRGDEKEIVMSKSSYFRETNARPWEDTLRVRGFLESKSFNEYVDFENLSIRYYSFMIKTTSLDSKEPIINSRYVAVGEVFYLDLNKYIIDIEKCE